VAVDTGFVEEGVSLGSGRVRLLKSPRVLLAWDRPASSLSAGWARWVLERRFGQPSSAVRVASLGRADLRRFDVVVLPSGDYGEALGDEAVRRLRDWVERGGTLVALGEASRWLTRRRRACSTPGPSCATAAPSPTPPTRAGRRRRSPRPTSKPFDLEKAIQPERERPDAVPGALLRVSLDGEHWLAAGTGGEVHAVVESRRVFTPMKLDKGTNVGLYGEADQVVASGFVWDDLRRQLSRKAYLMHQPVGEGHVVAFAEDPNFRGYAEATELLFVNAVLLGPAY
jgi:hypothetical protein